jgi:aspartyl-tRNA(Asn)/glutamyl-tRNA(Gln) amidotransferase subunit A
MSNPVDGAKRLLLLSSGASDALRLARTLPAGGMLILVENDANRGAAARRRFAEAGIADRASVIIGEPARMLYKLAGPFDLIVTDTDHPEGDPLRPTLDRLLATGGQMTTCARMALARIHDLNATLNAFITVFDSEVDKGPRADGPLRGMPISIKDLIDVEGTPTTAASRVRAGHVAAKDATVVERLRNAGAVIIGKTNLHEFALGVTNEESAYGPARNPHDPSRSPGGSSGGSAAAVAAGMSWASIGTDTGGSIRIPAAACGVVGLKPETGEIPTTGVFPLSASLDHVGPLAQSVTDAWTIYEVLKATPPSPKEAMPASAVRLGRLVGYFLEILDTGVRRRFDQALERLRTAGATIVDLSIPHASNIASTYAGIVLPEAFAVHARTLGSHAAGYSADVRARLEAGRDVAREDYVRAQEHRATLRTEVDTALSTCDALVLPTLPVLAPVIGATTIEVGGSPKDVRPLMLRLTQLFNLTGHPAISLPCGTSEGLPCGLQLVGRRSGTVDLLRLSLGCEPYVTPDARAGRDDLAP